MKKVNYLKRQIYFSGVGGNQTEPKEEWILIGLTYGFSSGAFFVCFLLSLLYHICETQRSTPLLPCFWPTVPICHSIPLFIPSSFSLPSLDHSQQALRWLSHSMVTRKSWYISKAALLQRLTPWGLAEYRSMQMQIYIHLLDYGTQTTILIITAV